MDANHKFTREDTNFIQGYYNESLTPELHQRLGMRPALFVDIDCDLYISTYQALDWLFTSKIIAPGTLVGYDDWCLTKLGVAGESRAHDEIALKHKVTFRCVVGACSDEMMLPGTKHNFHIMRSSKMLNPVFLVESITVTHERLPVGGRGGRRLFQIVWWEQPVRNHHPERMR
jgi:hypothetical protein